MSPQVAALQGGHRRARAQFEPGPGRDRCIDVGDERVARWYAALAAMIAAAIAVVGWSTGWRGGDLSAQLFRVAAVVSIEGPIVEGGRIKLVSMADPKRTFKLKVTAMRAPNHMQWADGMPSGCSPVAAPSPSTNAARRAASSRWSKIRWATRRAHHQGH